MLLHLIIIYSGAIDGIGRLNPRGTDRLLQDIAHAVVGDKRDSLFAAVDGELCEVGSHLRVFAFSLVIAVGGTGIQHKGEEDK